MIPTRPLELLTDPAAVADTLRIVRSLQRLKLVITCQGRTTIAGLQVAEGNCVIPAAITIEGGSGTLDPETITWRDRALAAGGTFHSNSISIANRLIIAIKATPFNSKILYLLPLLGKNLATARVPLRDFFAVGIATNLGSGLPAFAESQFSQSTGLQNITALNAGSFLDLKVLTSQLGSGSGAPIGGLGYWERNAPGAGASQYVMGYTTTSLGQRYALALDSVHEFFAWGEGPGDIYSGVGVGNHHYYGQRTIGDDRRLYRDGLQIGANVSSASTSQINNAHGYGPYGITLMGLVGHFHGFFYAGRCGVAYMTDGTMTDPEIAQFHAILSAKLIGPTGR